MKNVEMSNYHTCAYCGKEYESNKPFSHIIPKQFFKRFKRGTGNKDAYSTYHKRLTQREPKEFLLCYTCEEIFCKWENAFAKNITNKLYEKQPPDNLIIDVNVKLATLSILWRILHCWAVSNDKYRGTLLNSDIEFLLQCEQDWLEILRQKRDFTKKEANIFIIPVDCIDSNNLSIQHYKIYPGIMGNVIFCDQDEEKGYFCIRCLAHKVLIFAYSTPFFSIPREFSIHNKIIQIQKTFIPPQMEYVFDDYAHDVKKIKI